MAANSRISEPRRRTNLLQHSDAESGRPEQGGGLTSPPSQPQNVDQNYANLEDCVCSICMDYFIEAVETECQHRFCKYCLDRWVSFNPTRKCPSCRRNIGSIRNLPDFDAQITDTLITSFGENELQQRDSVIAQRMAHSPFGVNDSFYTDDDNYRLRWENDAYTMRSRIRNPTGRSRRRFQVPHSMWPDEYRRPLAESRRARAARPRSRTSSTPQPISTEFQPRRHASQNMRDGTGVEENEGYFPRDDQYRSRRDYSRDARDSSRYAEEPPRRARSRRYEPYPDRRVDPEHLPLYDYHMRRADGVYNRIRMAHAEFEYHYNQMNRLYEMANLAADREPRAEGRYGVDQGYTDSEDQEAYEDDYFGQMEDRLLSPYVPPAEPLFTYSREPTPVSESEGPEPEDGYHSRHNDPDLWYLNQRMEVALSRLTDEVENLSNQFLSLDARNGSADQPRNSPELSPDQNGRNNANNNSQPSQQSQNQNEPRPSERGQIRPVVNILRETSKTNASTSTTRTTVDSSTDTYRATVSKSSNSRTRQQTGISRRYSDSLTISKRRPATVSAISANQPVKGPCREQGDQNPNPEESDAEEEASNPTGARTNSRDVLFDTPFFISKSERDLVPKRETRSCSRNPPNPPTCSCTLFQVDDVIRGFLHQVVNRPPRSQNEIPEQQSDTSNATLIDTAYQNMTPSEQQEVPDKVEMG